ncbi:MAG: 2Fe-2S iron-sulfur cluster-binding protein [Methylophilaceae bacterium]|nr:2Fe-2S iron-sulfur cluster-binding protein [Methylophilaceae bacterium]
MFFLKKKPAHTITILPHPTLCPEGEVVAAQTGKSIAEILLDNDIEISHSCQLQCACTTCHVHLMEGEAYVSKLHAEEDRMLNTLPDRRRWSRLACQAIYQGGGNVVVEICN